MPRASDYLMEGYTYHLTHKCHNGNFLLRFARDRDTYRMWLHEGVKRYRVPVFGFCITANHVHILAHADCREAIGALMRLVAGSLAKHYNLRKDRLGSVWQHPYNCTVVESGCHLRNCLLYINLNMVRAGVVAHPGQWKWCGHDELTGQRKRYRIVDRERLLESLGMASDAAMRDWYWEALDERLERRRLQREAFWTESLAVGSPEFVTDVSQAYADFGRVRFVTEAVSGVGAGDGVWAVRELPEAYG